MNLSLTQLYQEDFDETDKRKYKELTFSSQKNLVDLNKKNFKISNRISDGSYSNVYIANMGQENIPVAIKILKKCQTPKKINISHEYVQEYVKTSLLKKRKYLDCSKYFINSNIWKDRKK